jgi:hypothetical protein
MLLTGVEKHFDRSEKDLSLQSKSFFTGVKSKKDGEDYPDSCYISYAEITLVLHRTLVVLGYLIQLNRFYLKKNFFIQ